MAKSINPKNTKAQILEAYAELKQEKSQLESEVKQLEKEKQAVVRQPLKAVQENLDSRTEKTNTGQTALPKINQTIQSLELLKLGFGSAVSNLSESLIAEASSLEEIQGNVNDEKQQLQELYELEDITENTLDDLIVDYEDSAKTFDEELTQQQETLEQQIQDLNKAWYKEKETHRRELQKRNEDYKKTRQRNEEEYRYNLALERELDEEEYQQNKDNLYKELAEIRQTQEKEWTEREKSISEREKQFAIAKARVEAFPQELEETIKKAKEEGKGIGHYQAKVKADLRAKEVEGQKRYYELRIESLNQSIQSQEARIQSLSQQLDAALKQVQDLAVKAIEGASNASSFQTMKELLQEQVKNQQKTKG